MTEILEIDDYIGKCALGNRAAFTALYSATSAKLFGVCLRVLNNREEAEDARPRRVYQNLEQRGSL